MGEIIKIPIDGGYNKQADPKLVGSGFKQVENLHNLSQGVFTLRNGFSSATTVSNRNALDWCWWIEPISETLYWIGYDYDVSKQIFKVDNAFVNNENLEALTTNSPNRVFIYNYGNAVRIAKGINHNPSVYQKIDRNFFNSGISYLHWQFSAELDTDETITLIDTNGVSKTYKSYLGYNENQGFTGGVAGGSTTVWTAVNTTLDSYEITLIGLKADASTQSITYYFESDGTKSTGDVAGGFTYVDISSVTTIAEMATEFSNAILHTNGHNGLIDTNHGGTCTAGVVCLRQSIAGSGGATTVTEGGGNQGNANKLNFTGGSTDTSILVSNESADTVNRTAELMAIEFETAINHKNGHNGSLSVIPNVASDGTTALTGGVYIKQSLYTSITGTTATLTAGFTADCTLNPNGIDNGATSATFTSGVGYVFDNFYYDPINYPRFATMTVGTPTFVDGGTLPFTTSDKSVHYRIAPVFDGVQEGLMNSDIIGPVSFSGDASNTISFTVKFDETDYNPRLTGLNIYRAITDGEYPDDGYYYFIKTVNITGGVESQWINSRLGYKGRSLFSAWDTDNFTTTYEANTYTNVDGLFESFSSIGAGPVSAEEGDLYMDEDDATLGSYNFGVDISKTSSSWRTLANTEAKSCRTIQEVKKRFLLLDDDTYNDRFGEDRDWVIMSDNWTNSGLLSSRNGGNTWGTFDNSTGITISNGTVGSGYLSYSQSSWGSGGAVHTADLFEETDANTGFIGGELFYFKMLSEGAYSNASGVSIKISIVDWTGGSAGSQITYFTQSMGFGYADMEKYGMFKLPSNCTAFKVKATASHTHTSNNTESSTTVRCKDIVISQVKRAGQLSWSHQSMWAVDGLGLLNDQAIGNRAVIDGSSFFVSDNIDDVCRNSGNSDFDDLSLGNSKNRVISGTDTSWDTNGNEHTLTVVDAGLGATANSPLSGVTSLDSRYKFSDTVSGRTFGCNVNLFDDFGENNAYDDMVIYSELQQPDVLPISNYIKLNDLQGGAIVGVAGLMADLVVFAERGIFRLNIPSGDPTAWSLIESEPNLGCSNSHSIKKWKNGVFFAGIDNIYYITPNFEFVAISENWRDDYQSSTTTLTETVVQNGSDTEGDVVIEIDNNSERLLVRTPGDPYRVRIMDLNAFAQQKLIWYDYVSDSFSYSGSASHTTGGNGNLEGKIHSFVARNDSKIYMNMISANGNDTKFRELDSGALTTGEPRVFLKTGYITLSSMTDNEDMFIRRLNIHYSSDEPLKISIKFNKSSEDYGTTDAITSYNITKTISGGANQRSIRIGRRAKGLEILFETTQDNTTAIQIKDIELEVD